MSNSRNNESSPYLPEINKVEGYRIGIMAKSGHGKSYLARWITEQIIEKYKMPVIIIEPVIEYESLLELYPGIIFKDDDENTVPLEPLTMAEASVEVPVVIINYENTTMSRAREIMTRYLEILIDKAKKRRTPFLLVIEEAHLLAPQRYTKNTLSLLEKIEYIAKVGRKLGINYLLITQRPASLNKDVLSQINMLFSGAFSNPRDVKATIEIAETLGIAVRKEEISGLARGQFIEICCNKKLYIVSPEPKSRHLGGTPTVIRPVVEARIKTKELIEKAKERLSKAKKTVTLPIEEYKRMKEELENLRRLVKRLEKERDELRLKLETIQLVAEKILGGRHPSETITDNNRVKTVLQSLPKLEQCIYSELSREPTGKLPLSQLARKCGSTRKSSRFLQALRRLRELGFIDYSTRRGRAWKTNTSSN